MKHPGPAAPVRTAIAAALLSLTACGAPPPGGAPDSGPAADAGGVGVLDGGEATDGGEPPDGGQPADGGESPDAGAADAGLVPDGGLDAGASPPPRYPLDRTHSPLTAGIARHLREIARRGPEMHDDVFAKVGDSITVSTRFLHCFAGSSVDLAGRDELRPALELFRGGDAAGTNPFQRASLTATGGWSSTSAVAGDPSPLEREVAAISPRFAVVMFGTNDVTSRTLWQFAQAMTTLVDSLLARGVIPALSSIPPRDDNPAYDQLVPHFNAVIRGLAQGRQIPFMDYHRELLPLPSHGLASDGVHPNSYVVDGFARPCVLTAEGLRFGYNKRNLLALTALARMSSALRGEPAPDEPPAPLEGDGTAGRPFEIDTLPFADLRDTSRAESRVIDRYPGCGAAQDESGPEVFYRLVVRTPVTVRARVFDGPSVDVDLHLLSAPSGEACVRRHDREIVATLAPGTHYFALDTFAGADGVPRAGEFLFTLVPEAP
jgi:hypothetical protein